AINGCRHLFLLCLYCISSSIGQLTTKTYKKKVVPLVQQPTFFRAMIFQESTAECKPDRNPHLYIYFFISLGSRLPSRRIFYHLQCLFITTSAYSSQDFNIAYRTIVLHGKCYINGAFNPLRFCCGRIAEIFSKVLVPTLHASGRCRHVFYYIKNFIIWLRYRFNKHFFGLGPLSVTFFRHA